MLDSTIVRAHQHSAGAKGGEPDSEAIGPSRGGLSTKLHGTVDALGNPLGFHLTPSQACDLEGADVLLEDINSETLIADKGYDADEWVLKRLEAKGKTAVIPPKRNRMSARSYDKH